MFDPKSLYETRKTDIIVRTPYGYKQAESVHKTLPQKTLNIITSNAEIRVSKNHIFLGEFDLVQASALKIGDKLQTKHGISTIIDITEGPECELYDLTLTGPDNNELFYTNDFISHNSGKTTTIAIYAVWCLCFMRNITIGITANRIAQAQEFLKTIKLIFSELPIWIKPAITSYATKSIETSNGTRIVCDAPNGDAFRGFTINVLIVDECAFIDPKNWKEFADSVFPTQSALSWKKNIIASTPKGKNHFYDIVQKAKEHNNLITANFEDIPRYNSRGEIISSDKFKSDVIKQYGEIYFNQNYNNVFIGSEHVFYDSEKLNFEPKEIVTFNFSGHEIQVFEECVSGHAYVIGVDTSKGYDYFAIQVLDVTNPENILQVASFNDKVEYASMVDTITQLGYYYNSATIIIENNEGSGQSVNDMVLKQEYPNLYFDEHKKYPGFRTTPKSKSTILTNLKKALPNVILRDVRTVKQFDTFILDKNGKSYCAISPNNDDLIMALCMCFILDFKNCKDNSQYSYNDLLYFEDF